MQSRKAVDTFAILSMIIICFTWAFQQIAIKWTSDLATPLMQIALRSGVAALCVYLLIRVQGERVPFTGQAARFGAVAGILFSAEFFLIGEALRNTSVGHFVVFLNTASIFAAVGLHFRLPSERLTWLQWLGIALAATGIAIAFLMRSDLAVSGHSVAQMLWGDLLAILAGMTWGATTVVIRTTALGTVPATHTLFYQLGTAFILLMIGVAVTGQTLFVPTTGLFVNLAFQSVIVSFLSFLAWFWLLTRYQASQLGVFTFMTPLFGVTLGVLLLDEPLTLPFLIGSALVIVGITLVSAAPWIKARFSA